MNNHEALPEVLPEAAPAVEAPSAGAILTRAREATGLSVDAVAQQLKLAPRQVRALETDDFALLPGRTFVRGFVRNYARLVRVDPVVVLAALPEAIGAPAAERQVLASGPRTIGEIPTASGHSPGVARWAIPLALCAIVGAAVYYELGRPPAESRRVEPAHKVVSPAIVEPAPAASTTLPNPLAVPPEPVAASTPAAPGAAAAPSASPAFLPLPAATLPGVPAGEATLEFSFRGQSWVEVRDLKGAVIMSTMGTRGATQAVTSTPPLDVTVGNASEVDVSFGGARIDTVPYRKQNVARLRVPLPAAAPK